MLWTTVFNGDQPNDKLVTNKLFLPTDSSCAVNFHSTKLRKPGFLLNTKFSLQQTY